MSDSVVSLAERALDHLRELEARRADPDAVREWAMRHFERLGALEQALRAQPDREADAPDEREHECEHQHQHEGLLEALRGFASAQPGTEIDAGLSALLRITRAQRGFIAVPGSGGALSFLAARTFDSLDMASPEAAISKTILRRAIHGASTILVEDATRDPRFEGRASVDRLALRAVLVVPLTNDGRPFGVLYLDNPTEAAVFSERERQAAETFASLIAPRLSKRVEADAVARGRRSAVERLRRQHDLRGLALGSAATLDALQATLSAARRRAPICFVGEPGTGKRLLAEIAHHNSGRSGRDWVELACARGLELGPMRAAVDAAGETSLLIHRADALSPSQQLELARMLDGSTARLLVTSREPLTPKHFEHELLYRVHVVEVSVAPLRARVGDIDPIAAVFLAERRQRLPAGALPLLEFHPWEGNVRQLRAELERALSQAGDETLRRRHFRSAATPEAPLEDEELGLKAAVRAFRRRFVQKTMRDAEGDHQRAASELGVHPKYLYKLLRDLHSE